MGTGMKSIICFGEVLWDVLPSGKKLGGAPLNVSLRVQSLGNRALMISSIGKDPLGEEIAQTVKAHGGSLNHIQVTEKYPTSEVLVKLDEDGTASYEIKMSCAWDHIELLERDIRAVEASDALVYGSLVTRSSRSWETLSALLEHARFKVFDVNLRPPHYTPERIMQLIESADFVKFNEEELLEICDHLEFRDPSIETCIRFVSGRTGTDQICVTRGKDGAILFYDKTFYYNPGYPVKVADTVGAGDSFLASIISQLLHGRKPQEAIDSACAIGSIVASRSGANPEVTTEEVQTMIRSRPSG